MAQYNRTAQTIAHALETCQDDIEGKDLKKLTLTVWFDPRTGEPRDTEVTPVRNVAPERGDARSSRDFASEERAHNARLSAAKRLESIPQRLAANEAAAR